MNNEQSPSPSSDPSSPLARGQFFLDSTVHGLGRLDIDLNALQGLIVDPECSVITTSQSIEWLQTNFHAKEDGSLPRNLLHHHYHHYCQARRLTSVTGATFGKLVRTVFPEMRIRRLGNRGQSRYHYCGLAPRETSPYFQDYRNYETERMKRKCASNGIPPSEQEITSMAAATSVRAAPERTAISESLADDRAMGMMGLDLDRPIKDEDEPTMHGFDGEMSTLADFTPDPQMFKDSFAAWHCPVRNSPRSRESILSERGSVPVQFPDKPWTSLPAHVSADDVKALMDNYKAHLIELIDLVYQTNFPEIESMGCRFWQTLPSSADRLLECTEVINLIALWDDIFYTTVVQILLPTVTMSVQGQLTVAIRDFAKGLERWQTTALAGRPNALLTQKLEVASMCASCLRGQTSLNHLAQAARAVLQNEEVVGQMVIDWGHVDFGDVEAQARWAFGNEDMDLLKNLYTGLTELLEEVPVLEDYVDWLDNLVEDYISNKADLQSAVEELGTFMLRWSFLTALIIRDLTLRSAVSFGHFHLMRLLFDEYILHMVETYKKTLFTQELQQKALGLQPPSASMMMMNPTPGMSPE
eukprot:Ihof_evm1s565 gene=Ihof_evmTU1s565